MWDKIKHHPWIVGGIVGVVILVVILSSSSSSSSANTTTTGAYSDPNGDQLQAYLANLNMQGQLASAAANSQDKQTAAAVTVAQLQASSTDLANTLAAQVAEYNTNAGATTQQNYDTLSAQVANHQIDAQTQQAQITANENINLSNNYTQMFEYQQENQYNMQAENNAAIANILLSEGK